MSAQEKRARFMRGFARVGTGIDNDESDEYDGNESKEEAG